jgi:hypothetical protein
MSTDLAGYASHLDRAARDLPDALRTALGAGMDGAAAEARRLAAARLAGASAADLQAIQGSASADLVGRVYGDTGRTVWLQIQEEGGTVVAQRSPYLFVPQDDGSFRLVRRVTLRPRRFIGDAFEAQLPDIRRRLSAALAEEVAL